MMATPQSPAATTTAAPCRFARFDQPLNMVMSRLPSDIAAYDQPVADARRERIERRATFATATRFQRKREGAPGPRALIGMVFMVERVKRLSGVALRLLGLLLVVSGCSEGPFLMTEEYVSDAAGERYVGGGCISVQKGNGMGGGSIPVMGNGGQDGEGSTEQVPGFAYSYDGTGDAVDFKATNGAGVVLAERSYDSEFLLSGQRDEVAIDVTGATMRFVHWGGAKCAEPREPDPE
jgi:hypothetical protein